MNDYLKTLRRFNRNVRLLFVANAILGFVFFGIYALLLNLYLLRLGYGDAEVKIRWRQVLPELLQ